MSDWLQSSPLVLTPALAKHWADQGLDISGFRIDAPIPTDLYVEKIAKPIFAASVMANVRPEIHNEVAYALDLAASERLA